MNHLVSQQIYLKMYVESLQDGPRCVESNVGSTLENVCCVGSWLQSTVNLFMLSFVWLRFGGQIVYVVSVYYLNDRPVHCLLCVICRTIQIFIDVQFELCRLGMLFSHRISMSERLNSTTAPISIRTNTRIRYLTCPHGVWQLVFQIYDNLIGSVCHVLKFVI